MEIYWVCDYLNVFNNDVVVGVVVFFCFWFFICFLSSVLKINRNAVTVTSKLNFKWKSQRNDVIEIEYGLFFKLISTWQMAHSYTPYKLLCDYSVVEATYTDTNALERENAKPENWSEKWTTTVFAFSNQRKATEKNNNNIKECNERLTVISEILYATHTEILLHACIFTKRYTKN